MKRAKKSSSAPQSPPEPRPTLPVTVDELEGLARAVPSEILQAFDSPQLRLFFLALLTGAEYGTAIAVAGYKRRDLAFHDELELRIKKALEGHELFSQLFVISGLSDFDIMKKFHQLLHSNDEKVSFSTLKLLLQVKQHLEPKTSVVLPTSITFNILQASGQVEPKAVHAILDMEGLLAEPEKASNA